MPTDQVEQIISRLTAPGAPFELIERQVDGRSLRSFRHAPATLGDIYRTALAHDERPCLVGLDRGLSYREVLGRAAALGDHLHDQGIDRGMRVALALGNRPEWAIAYIAITAIGATPALVNPRSAPAEIASALTDSDSRLVIAAEGFVDGLAAAPPHLATGDPFDAATAGWKAAALTCAPMAPDDEATIIFTSGTTGTPKGAILTQRAMTTSVMTINLQMAAAAIAAGVDPFSPPDPSFQPSAMLVFPLFHMAGVTAVLLPGLARGGKMALIDRWRVDDVMTLIERERIHGFAGSPAMLWDLLHAADEGRDLSALRFLSIGGQGLSTKLLDGLRAAFPDVSLAIGYGQTETGSVSSIGGGELYARPSASGRPLPTLDIRIVGDDEREVVPGAVGEIRIRGATTMSGYCGRPAESAAVLNDGWVATGDLGRLDADGYLHVVDRKKNMVLSGGENIGCIEVEAAALDHPHVAQAVAFGVPDDRLGERLMLAVVAQAGILPDGQAILAHIGERLARFKVPRGILFVDRLPVNAMDKPDRRALAAQVQTDEESA